jgi:hypothetical protein
MGRVVDANGEPVAQALVVARAEPGDEPAAAVASPPEARTGPDGTFQIETATGADLAFEVRTGVEPSVTRWVVQERDEFREDGVWRTLLLVKPAPPTAPEAAPEPAANVDFRVRVVDAQGHGVAGARLEAGYVVGISHYAFELTGRARTDTEGRAVVVGRPLPDSPPLVLVYPPGRPAFAAALPRTAQDSRGEVAIPLPSGVLRGRLRSPEGAASRVPLSLRLEVCPGTRVGAFAVHPDAEGRFVVEGLGEGDPYVVGARGPEVLVSPPPVVRAGEDLDLVVATPEQAYGLCVEVQLDLAAMGAPDSAPPQTGAVAWRKDGLLSMLVDLLPLPEPGVWRSARPLPPGPCHLDVLFPGFLPVPFDGVRISSVGPPLRLRVDLRR